MDGNELHKWDATGLAALIRTRQVSAAEVTYAHLDRIEAVGLKVIAISVRGPAPDTRIVALKATRGRTPVTGHWPEVPRRYWHVGPMAQSVRDIATALSVLAGPDGEDGYVRHAAVPATGFGR